GAGAFLGVSTFFLAAGAEVLTEAGFLGEGAGFFTDCDALKEAPAVLTGAFFPAAFAVGAGLDGFCFDLFLGDACFTTSFLATFEGPLCFADFCADLPDLALFFADAIAWIHSLYR